MKNISAVDGRSSGVFRAFYATYKKIFPKVYVFAGVPDKLCEDQNNLLFAADKDGELNQETLKELQKELFKESNPPARYTQKIEPGLVLKDDYAPMESLVASAFK